MYNSIKLINALHDAQYYSDCNREYVQTCIRCLHQYKIGNDDELKGVIDVADGIKLNVHIARWKYNKDLKRKIYVCPNCGCGCGIYVP